MTDRSNASAPNHGDEPAGAARGHRAVSVEAAAAAGLASSVHTLVALSLLSQFLRLSLDDASLSAWFDDDGHRARLILGLNLLTMGSVAFLWFVAVIRRRLGHRENRFFATAFFGSAIILVATGLAGAGLLAAPAVAMTILDAGTVSPASASLAAGAGGSMLLVIAPRFQAVFVLATANLFRQSEIAPRWLVGRVHGDRRRVVHHPTGDPVGRVAVLVLGVRGQRHAGGDQAGHRSRSARRVPGVDR